MQTKQSNWQSRRTLLQGLTAGGGAAFDRSSLADKLKTLKASLPDQSAIAVQPEDAVAYDDLVSTVDICLGEQLRNVTVAPLN